MKLTSTSMSKLQITILAGTTFSIYWMYGSFQQILFWQIDLFFAICHTGSATIVSTDVKDAKCVRALYVHCTVSQRNGDWCWQVMQNKSTTKFFVWPSDANVALNKVLFGSAENGFFQAIQKKVNEIFLVQSFGWHFAQLEPC